MKTTDINTLSIEQLTAKVENLERQLEDLEFTPFYVQNGSIKNENDIVRFLSDTRTSTEHLLVIQEMIAQYIWAEHEAGCPHEIRARIIKEVQIDLHYLYSAAIAAKYLKNKNR